MDRSPIENTLERINRAYQPGCLARVKQKRPKEWRRMVTLEREINCATFQGDEVKLVNTLNEYQVFVLGMVKIFKLRTMGSGNLFEKEMRQ